MNDWDFEAERRRNAMIARRKRTPDPERLFKFGAVLAVVWSLLSLAIVIAAVYVAWHFIEKYW